jgi:hypothetical protein
MSTVFTIGGLGGEAIDYGTAGHELDYMLKGQITKGNTVVPIYWPSLNLDSLLIGLGPTVIPDSWLSSINTGRDSLDTQLHATSGPKVVFAHSAGAVIACRWLHDYGPTSTIPPTDLSFVLIGNSVRRYGGPFYNDDYGAPVDTRYPVRDIRQMYDGFCDFPNVPSSANYLLAVTNAVIGSVPFHLDYTNVDAYDPNNPTFVEGNITYVLSPTRPWWQNDYTLNLIETAYDRPETNPTPTFLPPIAPPSTSPLKVRYPVNPITPVGAAELLSGKKPKMTYRAFDDSTVFELMGPLSYADPMTPESIRVKDLKGLIPPWSNITQKGATQDGSTYITSLYDESEVDMTVVARGRMGEYTRKLIRTWIDSWDPKKPGELSWWTHEQGRWWAPVRWGKQPLDKLMGGNWTRQQFGWVMKIYDAFWRSYDCVDEFSFLYSDENDDFSYTTTSGLGAGWTVAYQAGSGAGTGSVYVDSSEVVPSNLSPDQTMVARRDTFTVGGDNGVASITFGNVPEWSFPAAAENDIWARMPASGTPGTDGVRLRIAAFEVTLSYFVGGVETILRTQPLLTPPQVGEKWTLIFGTSDDAPRTFKVQRKVVPGNPAVGGIFTGNGSDVMTVVENGTGSPVGAGYRKTGFGMHAGDLIFWLLDALPGSVLAFNAGTNSTAEQDGVLTRYNVGDQPAWDRLTFFGPGLLKVGNGPGSSEMVEYGPLLDGQVVQIRTDPRKTSVVDLTSTPTTPQQSTQLDAALADILSWATGNNQTMLLNELRSIFGIAAPQGNLYALLKGRWSNPIPEKSPGDIAKPYQVKVSIEGGNANSRVIAALTPLRRYPS